MSNTFTGKVSGRMSSRGWAIALGIGAVVLAAILLVVYLDRYRARVGGGNAPTPVLVANRLIPVGTPGVIAATNSMYTATTLPRKEVEVGAIADPSYLAGRAAAAEIFPGQQITVDRLRGKRYRFRRLADHGTQRAFSISIDNVHGSLSQVQAGDSVDVYTSVAGVVKLFEPNVKVLTIPADPRPERWLEPRPPHRDGRRGEVGLSRPTTRSSSSSSARWSAPSPPSRRPRMRLRC